LLNHLFIIKIVEPIHNIRKGVVPKVDFHRVIKTNVEQKGR